MASGSAAGLPAAPRGYETVRLLGSGGFGEVTLARHIAMDRLVAIKYLRAVALADPDALDRFRREAVILAGLEDPTVVRVHDVRLSDPEPAIIMEYVPGEALDALLERRALSVPESLKVLSDVATALQNAAARGIAHRDVKPANVFVLPDGHAKLGDFGLARIATDHNMFRTSADTIGGTPAYLPPEVALGTAEPDARSDTYSFAVMAYEMLTGRLPFVDRGIMGLIAAHASEPVPAPESVLPGFPKKASAALLRALAKEPERRPQPSRLVETLEEVPVQSWPAALDPAPLEAAEHTRRIAPAARSLPAAVRPRRRNVRPWLIGGAAGLLAALAVLLAVLLTHGTAAKAGPLVVTAANVQASMLTGRCPQAVWVFTGHVSTNGAPGRLTLRWLRPDGKATAEQFLTLREGQRLAKPVLRFTVTGTQPLRGVATLQLLGLAQRSAASQPVSYSCPGAGR